MFCFMLNRSRKKNVKKKIKKSFKGIKTLNSLFLSLLCLPLLLGFSRCAEETVENLSIRHFSCENSGIFFGGKAEKFSCLLISRLKHNLYCVYKIFLELF